MLVAGLVLVILAVLLVLFGLFGGGGQTLTFDLGGLGTWSVSPAAIFLLGVAATLLLFLGLVAMRVGARRARANRQNRKKVDELSTKLDEVRRDEPPVEGTTTPRSTENPDAAQHREQDRPDTTA